MGDRQGKRMHVSDKGTDQRTRDGLLVGRRFPAMQGESSKEKIRAGRRVPWQGRLGIRHVQENHS